MNRRRISLAIALVIAISGIPLLADGAAEQVPLLVDSDWLGDNLGKEGLVVVDFGTAKQAYQAGHIPGAVFVERSAAYATVNQVSGMLPRPEAAVEHFEKAGISNKSRVVIYDATGGLWASRLFWALEYFGHEKVHILDGGYPAWSAEEREISTDTPAVQRGNFKLEIRDDLVADTAFILENLENAAVQVVDARSPGEYSGGDVRAARGGHIPGAVNLDWGLNLDDNRQFLSLQELAEVYDSADISKDKTQITHCQTGVRGAHTYFVLRYLGYKDVRLYDESWVVWGNSTTTPIDQ